MLNRSKVKPAAHLASDDVPHYDPKMREVVEIIKAHFTVTRAAPKPTAAVPLVPMTQAQLVAHTQPVLYRLGHSSILMKLDGMFVLADPVFSERASPLPWMGPKRFHPTPITLDELPAMDVVLISHDHYDHLDKAAVKQLAHKVGVFIAPLGVGALLRKWGIGAHQIIELDWWQSHPVGTLHITLTPTQHFSGRGLTDRNRTLWGSFVIQSSEHRLFFSGDSGYFDGFKTIGERFGPFDIAMIETGAYNTLWPTIHMMPNESLQAALDVQAKAMLPIHNSTFDLSMHDWFDPLEQIQALAEQHALPLLTPIIGEALAIGQPQATPMWWREMMPQPESATQLQG